MKSRPDVGVLEEIQRRVLWLATRMVDAANHDRTMTEGVKVGGHQASSASLVSVLTALWFGHLDAEDRVSVKPHAAPAFHAIQYLLGNLDRSFLTELRARGGLQSYPSRSKDPDGVDFSTGSVGLDAAAPLFAAATRRYVDAHFGERPGSRFYALLGDAELDDGSVWEAVADPALAGLGRVTWVVDANRQSPDRVLPGIRIGKWMEQFAAAGWHAVEVKYGQRLRAAFDLPGGELLRGWLDEMPNEHYQSMFGLTGSQLRQRFLDGAPPGVASLVAEYPDAELARLVTDLGGHDIPSLLSAFGECDAEKERPSVVFAYTVKGWGLPIAGHPYNDAALLAREQVDRLRAECGLDLVSEWDRFDPASPAGQWVATRREHLSRPLSRTDPAIAVPESSGIRTGRRPMSTQEAFGRVLVDLSRDEEVAPYLVTAAPEVATSTNLAGFINRVGVFAPTHRRAWSQDPVLTWAEGPDGQHIELGISERNLFMLLGQLGLSWDLSDQVLLPVGTIGDPLVLRGLDALLFAAYSGARFVVAGTPSGVTFSPEGGAHQSTITPSIGIGLPGITYCEPAYAGALDWLLCDAFGRVAAGPARGRGRTAESDAAYYFRLTARPIDQAPFAAARSRLGEAMLRRLVLSGAYPLVDASTLAEAGAPEVYVVGSGAVLPEALAAAEELHDEGVAARVVDVTSPDLLYRSWRQSLRDGVRTATTPGTPGALRTAFPVRAPIVTVHDAASHAMAWLGSAMGVPCVPLGVDAFGESGTVHDLYEIHDLLPGSIVNGALAALSLA